MRHGILATLLISMAFAITAQAGQVAGEGVPGSGPNPASVASGRGIGEFDFQQQQQGLNGQQFQQQTGIQQMQQQLAQIQQQGQALTQKKSSSRGAEESGQAAQAAQEAIKSSAEKQGEELKKVGESFLSSVGGNKPSDEGVKKEVGEALKQLSTPVASGALTEIAKGVVADIQALNAVQVGYITKIAEQFTAPPRSAPVPQKGTSLSTQIAAAGLNPRARPGNIFAEALNQISPVQVPQHSGQAFMESRSVSPGVMRGISSETIYNVPAGVSLHE